MANTENGGARVAPDAELKNDLNLARENLDDAKENLKNAIREVRAAKRRLRDNEAHTGRDTLLFSTGIALVILFNPATGRSTRRWLSDKIGGGTRRKGPVSRAFRVAGAGFEPATSGL